MRQTQDDMRQLREDMGQIKDDMEEIEEDFVKGNQSSVICFSGASPRGFGFYSRRRTLHNPADIFTLFVAS